MPELEDAIAERLLSESAALGARWGERARAAALGTYGPEEVCEVESLIAAIGRAITVGSRASAELARDGWRLGASRHDSGATLHQLVCELELLEAMLLHLAERVAGDGRDVGATAGIRAARTLQRSTSLVARAALKGFTHAYVERQRAHLRTLRHDLRNPLGTIRNIVSLHEDESIPATRRDPSRLRSIVTRNALQADVLIERHLTDGSVIDGALGRHEVALRDVVLAVRRTLRDAAVAAGTDIELDDSLSTLMVDATAVELLLMAALEGVLDGGSAVRVSMRADEFDSHLAHLQVIASASAKGEMGDIEAVRQLARLAGGDIVVDGSIVLEVPVSPRQAGKNVIGTSKGQHGQI